MPLLEWNEDLSIGIASLDEEHKIFFNHLNELYAAIQFGKASMVLEPLLNELIAYSTAHFAREEEYMLTTQFPGYDGHKAEHDKIRQKLAFLQEKSHEHYSVGLSNETFAFLKDWLTHHILSVDKAFVEHFKAHGIT